MLMPIFPEGTSMERIKNIKLFLFDMDGTLYRGEQIFAFTVDLLKTIRDRGGRYSFLTIFLTDDCSVLSFPPLA